MYAQKHKHLKTRKNTEKKIEWFGKPLESIHEFVSLNATLTPGLKIISPKTRRPYQVDINLLERLVQEMNNV